MEWSCTNSEERLSDFLEGALQPEEQAAFSAHTAGCRGCTEMVERVGGLLARMGQIALVQEPEYLAGKIVAATHGLRGGERDARWWMAWVPLIWQPRFAMGLATVAASLVIVLHAAGVSPSDLQKIDYRPASLARAGNRQAHLTYARWVKYVNDLRVVYEIESRFASSPVFSSEPAPTPTAEPRPRQEPASPDSNTRDKSQVFPRPGGREARRGSEVAVLITTEVSDNIPRRLL